MRANKRPKSADDKRRPTKERGDDRLGKGKRERIAARAGRRGEDRIKSPSGWEKGTREEDHACKGRWKMQRSSEIAGERCQSINNAGRCTKHGHTEVRHCDIVIDDGEALKGSGKVLNNGEIQQNHFKMLIRNHGQEKGMKQGRRGRGEAGFITSGVRHTAATSLAAAARVRVTGRVS